MEDSKLLSEHDSAVSRIQSQVRHFHETKRHFRVYHGSTSSTRATRFERDAIVDTSDMSRLFPVDTKAKTVKVEPNVAMDALIAHTMESDLVPKIVMELKGITVGGGYSSVSGESSMFKHGLFQQTISDVEIVLADGTLEHASRQDNSDLLEGAGGTMGTLGIVTLLTVELVDAKPYVDLELVPITNIEMIPEMMEKGMSEDIDYIDGVFFRPGLAVMMLGRMTDKPKAKVFAKKQVHWFADSIEAALKHKTDLISMKIEDYFFRYDHGAFWGAKLAFKHFHVPNNRITRKLADPLLDSRTCYHALHKTGLANEYVVQDFGIPASNVVPFINHVRKVLPESQLFLCPGQSGDKFRMAAKFVSRFAKVSDQRLYGIGVYGRGPSNPAAFVELNRELERIAEELHGKKVLYARVYYTEEEFWNIYDRAAYDELREKYRAITLPSIYDKLHADMNFTTKRRPIRGIVETVWDKVVGEKEYILKKKDG